MNNTGANYHAIVLSGTQSLGYLGNGITASTVHQIFCISAGTITIIPMIGDGFVWPATAGQSIDIVPSTTIVSSGGFIGFKAKHYPRQITNMNAQGTAV